MIENAEIGTPIAFQEEFDGLEPERTLVFEVAGSTTDCVAAIQQIPGLSVSFEGELDFPPDDDFSPAKDGDDVVGGRLYAIIPDLAALKQIVSLWELHQSNQPLPRGMSDWKKLFSHLRAIRPWGPEDRLLPETREYLSYKIEDAPNDPIRVEVQFWYRDQSAHRQENVESLMRAETSLPINIAAQCVIEPIQYHAVLVDLSPADVASLLEDAGSGVGGAIGIMHLKPQSVVDVGIALEDGPEQELVELQQPQQVGAIRVALLDGMPLQRHHVLDGRIELDDPDGFEATCPPSKRMHGTAMSSLILNGDLRAPKPLGATIYVRPILSYDPISEEERTPRDAFPLDLVFRAIRRMKEGEAGEPPTAPSAVIVNLSVGDSNQSFTGRAGPWARLIDYLAFRYKLLFVISAGNHTAPILLSGTPTITAFEALSPEERERLIVSAMFADRATRTLLSPAEAVNAITVAACHQDNTPIGPARVGMQHRPFLVGSLPNVSSAFGPGVRRSVKPDMVFDGGREYVLASPSLDGVLISPSRHGRDVFGLLAAAPDATGALNRTVSSHGTSDAAALVSHNLAQIVEVLDPSRDDSAIAVPEEYLALATKALAIHACKWGEEAERILDIVGPSDKRQHYRRRMNVVRAVGFGRPDFESVRECARNRAVMIDWGTLEQERSLIYRLPIPTELDGTREIRKAKVTIAWFSPINSRRAQHRAARFEISAGDEEGWWLGKDSTLSPAPSVEKNGTCAQLCLEASDVVHLAKMDGLGIRITCRPQYGSLDVAVPYALAMSFELAEASNVDVYEYVRVTLQERIRAAQIRTPA